MKYFQNQLRYKHPHQSEQNLFCANVIFILGRKFLMTLRVGGLHNSSKAKTGRDL